MLCVHQVTISLLDKAMLDSGKDRFLIDGFPRNEENRSAFEKQVQLPAASPTCHLPICYPASLTAQAHELI